MDYPVSDSLDAWLNGKGMRGNGAGTPALHGKAADAGREENRTGPARRGSGDETTAPMGMGKGRGKAPRQVQGGDNRVKVKTDWRGEPVGFDYGAHTGAAMAHTAMSNWRVIRQRPLLMIADGGRA